MSLIDLHQPSLSTVELAAGSFVLLCAASIGSAARQAGASLSPAKTLDAQIREWLRLIGLGETNPFEVLEAGADPNLSHYLVPHDVFDLLWQDQPTIVYAPAGGGKSAFRVRLAWASRVGEDGRRVFAIPYLAPDPDASTLSDHMGPILKTAARELFLMLAYRPTCFLDLSADAQHSIRRVLDQNNPGLVRRFLPQLRRAGSLDPLVEGHDASARRLTDPPEADEVRALCEELARAPEPHDVPPATERFEALLDVIQRVLGVESVYLLVDGIDAWLETRRAPAQAAAVLEPLLRQMVPWSARGLYLKLFLPIELQKILPNELTKHAQSAIIHWDLISLAEVLHRRLSASSGRFSRLKAISTLALDDAEEQILSAIQASPTPRELLVLVNRVIETHVRRDSQELRLEPQDVRAAIQWYENRPKPATP
ncbi:MAG: hypothetical protein JXA14_22760 [Anaerolineae bacterium]|nr:hypothetical protein [Anaerolineae bacterium]